MRSFVHSGDERDTEHIPMPLLGRISITSGHSVVPFMCPYFYRSFSLCLAFLLPFVWFATARNDIAPSRLYSILSSLISFPICVHARKVRRKTFPPLSLIPILGFTAGILLHLHHSLSSLQPTCCYSLCSMILCSYPSAYLRQAASVGLLRLSCSILSMSADSMLMRFCLPVPL